MACLSREHRGSDFELAEAYGRSIASLNQSLNGDLNLRVAEILGGGGCLVMDRLSPQSGLELLLDEKRDVVLYDSEEQASERLAELLQDPGAALEIARRGAERFNREFCFDLQRRRLLRLLTDGAVEDVFRLERELRCVPGYLADSRPLADRVPLYEHCQELNRTERQLRVGFDAAADPRAVLDLIDLQRTRVVVEEGPTSARLRLLDRFAEVSAQIAILPPPEFRTQEFDLFVPEGDCASGAKFTIAPKTMWCWNSHLADMQPLSWAPRVSAVR